MPTVIKDKQIISVGLNKFKQSGATSTNSYIKWNGTNWVASTNPAKDYGWGLTDEFTNELFSLNLTTIPNGTYCFSVGVLGSPDPSSYGVVLIERTFIGDIVQTARVITGSGIKHYTRTYFATITSWGAWKEHGVFTQGLEEVLANSNKAVTKDIVFEQESNKSILLIGKTVNPSSPTSALYRTATKLLPTQLRTHENIAGLVYLEFPNAPIYITDSNPHYIFTVEGFIKTSTDSSARNAKFTEFKISVQNMQHTDSQAFTSVWISNRENNSFFETLRIAYDTTKEKAPRLVFGSTAVSKVMMQFVITRIVGRYSTLNESTKLLERDFILGIQGEASMISSGYTFSAPYHANNYSYGIDENTTNNLIEKRFSPEVTITDWNINPSTSSVQIIKASANSPIPSETHGVFIPHGTPGLGSEIAFRNGDFYFRSLETGSWTPWKQVADRSWVLANTISFETDPVFLSRGTRQALNGGVSQGTNTITFNYVAGKLPSAYLMGGIYNELISSTSLGMGTVYGGSYYWNVLTFHNRGVSDGGTSYTSSIGTTTRLRTQIALSNDMLAFRSEESSDAWAPWKYTADKDWTTANFAEKVNTLTFKSAPSSGDFNSFITPGIYERRFATPAMSNEPPLPSTGKQGVLLVTVSRASAATIIFQEFKATAGTGGTTEPRIFQRRSHDGGTTWSPWIENATREWVTTELGTYTLNKVLSLGNTSGHNIVLSGTYASTIPLEIIRTTADVNGLFKLSRGGANDFVQMGSTTSGSWEFCFETKNTIDNLSGGVFRAWGKSTFGTGSAWVFQAGSTGVSTPLASGDVFRIVNGSFVRFALDYAGRLTLSAYTGATGEYIFQVNESGRLSRSAVRISQTTYNYLILGSSGFNGLHCIGGRASGTQLITTVNTSLENNVEHVIRMDSSAENFVLSLPDPSLFNERVVTITNLATISPEEISTGTFKKIVFSGHRPYTDSATSFISELYPMEARRATDVCACTIKSVGGRWVAVSVSIKP